MRLDMKIGDRVQLFGHEITFERDMGDGTLNFMVPRTGSIFRIRDEFTDELRLPTIDDVERAMAEDKFRKISGRKGPYLRRAETTKPVDADIDAIMALDSQARLRFRLLTDYDEAPVACSDRSLEKWIDEKFFDPEIRALGKRPSATSLRRWINNFGDPGNRSLQACVSRQGRVPRKSKGDPLFDKIVDRFVMHYWSDPLRDLVEIHAQCVKFVKSLISRFVRNKTPRAVKAPSYETLRRRKNETECFETWASRYGEKSARARFKGMSTGLKASRILELVIMDYTPLDVFAVDYEDMQPLGRPTLALMIDVYSRCVLGWYLTFEPPSLHTAIECVKAANRPKRRLRHLLPHLPDLDGVYGRPSELILDNGLENVSGSFRDGALDVGMHLRFCPIKRPQYKAIGERIFLTIKKLISTKVTGSVPFGVELMRELELNPKKTATLTLAELELLIEEAIGNYHYRVHRTIDAQPLRLWSEDVERHGIQVLRDPAALDDMLGFTERRKLTTSGIDLKSLEYRDPQVISDLLDDLARTSPGRQKLKGSASVWVKVKYSPANLGTVRVYNHVAGTYVTLPCTQPEYANGLSLWLHNILRKYTRIKNEKFMSTEDRCDALARFRASIDDFDPDMKFRHRRAVARLKHSPKFMDPDGHAVEVARANPRHDGLASVERPFDTLNRNDKGVAAPNARRGKPKTPSKPKAQGKPRTPKGEPAMIAPISGNATAFAPGGAIASSSEALSGLDWGNDL